MQILPPPLPLHLCTNRNIPRIRMSGGVPEVPTFQVEKIGQVLKGKEKDFIFSCKNMDVFLLPFTLIHPRSLPFLLSLWRPSYLNLKRQMEKQPDTGKGTPGTQSFLEAVGGAWPHRTGSRHRGPWPIGGGLLVKRGLQKALGRTGCSHSQVASLWKLLPFLSFQKEFYQSNMRWHRCCNSSSLSEHVTPFFGSEDEHQLCLSLSYSKDARVDQGRDCVSSPPC